MSEKLRVWYVENVPGNPIYFHVSSVQEAKLKIEELTHADLHNPDVYSNAMGLEEYDGEEWTEYYDEQGRDIMELMYE